VCMCVCVYVCAYIQIHITYTHVYILQRRVAFILQTYGDRCVCIHPYIYTGICANVRTCVRVYIHIHSACTYVYMLDTHTCTRYIQTLRLYHAPTYKYTLKLTSAYTLRMYVYTQIHIYKEVQSALAGAYILHTYKHTHCMHI